MILNLEDIDEKVLLKKLKPALEKAEEKHLNRCSKYRPLLWYNFRI